MSDHRTARRPRSGRVRAFLALGVALGIGATGTLAAWTDDVAISGTTFTSGSLDLRVNDQDAITAYTSLNLSNMVPGESVAAVLTVKNQGTSTLKWTATKSTTNTVTGKDLAAALDVKITSAAAISGTGRALTCGGTVIANSATTLATGSNTFIPTGRTLAASATEPICVQVTLNANASTTLQSAGTTATFTFTGTSDLS
ncbi:TasA family protein [Aeromicrobium alkaliterrae]|uniref:Ribosomally synthesized peptide with SipW-like signal peptide n=1 Tax=Aeromicrobium alkaliterrae TaxID=302168 RepID=A0ABN2JJH9_9ACTN